MSSQNGADGATVVDTGLFRRVCGRFATGVTVITTTTPDGEPHGLTANSFSSVSLDPPLILVCIDNRNSTLGQFLAGSPFAVNILADTGEGLSRRFAAAVDDRFDGVPWSHGTTGAPVLANTLGHFECVLEKAVEAGDHVVLIGAVKDLRLADEGEPLVFFDSAYRALL